METIVYEHITVGMIVTFFIGLSLVFVYGAWESKNIKTKDGYSIKKYAKPTFLNIVYQFLTGLLFLVLLHEISERLLKLAFLDDGNEYHMVLAALCGAFGGQLFAFIIEKGRLVLNVRDKEIAHTKLPELDGMSPLQAVKENHVHNENCNH